MAAAIAATTVLPEPTSPCNNLCMGLGLAKSWVISATALACARVKANGNCANKRLAKSPFFGFNTAAFKASRSNLACV